MPYAVLAEKIRKSIAGELAAIVASEDARKASTSMAAQVTDL
jgi:hypothetical protein